MKNGKSCYHIHPCHLFDVIVGIMIEIQNFCLSSFKLCTLNSLTFRADNKFCYFHIFLQLYKLPVLFLIYRSQILQNLSIYFSVCFNFLNFILFQFFALIFLLCAFLLYSFLFLGVLFQTWELTISSSSYVYMNIQTTDRKKYVFLCILFYYMFYILYNQINI